MKNLEKQLNDRRNELQDLRQELDQKTKKYKWKKTELQKNNSRSKILDEGMKKLRETIK